MCPALSEPACTGKKFRYVEGSAKCKDYQEIKLQERLHQLAQGYVVLDSTMAFDGLLVVRQMPKSMTVILEDDLVDACKGGDDVILTGVVMRRRKPLQADLRCDVGIVVVAHGVYVQNEEDRASVVTPEQRALFDLHWARHRAARTELAGRDALLSCVCPTAHGMYLVKLALLLVVIGGVESVDAHGTKVRGESHLLLVGDPGVGQSPRCASHHTVVSHLNFVDRQIAVSWFCNQTGTACRAHVGYRHHRRWPDRDGCARPERRLGARSRRTCARRRRFVCNR